jgi:2-methylcitrate dehydratase PrpD
MAKPFHAGKAAMDGVVSAQFAASGFEAATGLFEPGGGLDNALVQDRSITLAPVDFAGWRILDNSFKPYAACHLTHPAVDAARALAPGANALAALKSARVEVGALANQITGGRSGSPATPLDGKFDLKYCIALGLAGHDLSAADFREPWMPDPAVCDAAQKVEVEVSTEMAFASSRLSLEFADGRTEAKHVPVAKGHPGNPMNWADMEAKFTALTSPCLGPRSDALFGLAREFSRGGVLPEMRALLARLPFEEEAA